MRAYLFILASLAAFRITRLITTDTFPLVAKPRAALLRRYGTSSWSELLTCTYCLGAWIALGILALLKWLGYAHLTWGQVLLIWPALAGAQALLNALDSRLG